LIEIEDERRLRVFMERRMGQEVPGDSVGDEFKGYVFRITGGNDKQGFPMKQGVMHPTRVRLLLADGHSCYRPRRTGERKRKSVRGCIVGMDLSVLSLSIVKQGDSEIEGITDKVEPKRLGPKRASKIRKMFGLTKDDDVSWISLHLGDWRPSERKIICRKDRGHFYGCQRPAKRFIPWALGRRNLYKDIC